MYNYFIGIDISKNWFDACLRRPAAGAPSERFDNTRTGFERFWDWLHTQGVSQPGQGLLVMENTGLYSRQLWLFCQEHGLPVHVGNAAAIKWSMGLTRGKTDAVDARRLAEYAERHARELRPTPAPGPELWLLKDLTAMRTKLIGQKTALSVHLKELRRVNTCPAQQLIQQALQAALEGLSASIAAVQREIKAFIQADPQIKENYELLTSVPGIGHVTAVYLIGCTHNFARQMSGKQLACYAGVVPFEHHSGSSVRGRSRVSPMANKELKRLLHMGALSARRYDPELRAYFERKLAQGKHPMSILNALRNKIILRAAAVIRTRQKYQKREVSMAA